MRLSLFDFTYGMFFWLFFCFFYSFFSCCSLSLFLVSIVCLFSDIYPIQKRMNHRLKVVYLWKSSQNLKIIRTQLIESALLWQEEKKTRRKQIKKQNIHSMNDDKKVIESTQWAHDLLFFSRKNDNTNTEVILRGWFSQQRCNVNF